MDQDIVNHFVIMGPQGPDTMPQFQGIPGTGTSTRYSPHTWASVGAGAEKVGAEKWCVQGRQGW